MAVFNEDTRVKIPDTIQYMRLGYEYQSLKDADIDPDTRIFRNRFKPAIEAINGRSFTDAEIDALIAEIHDLIKYSDLGKAFYNWLINPQDRVKLIDFDHPEKNDFAVVNELTFGKDGAGDEINRFSNISSPTLLNQLLAGLTETPLYRTCHL